MRITIASLAIVAVLAVPSTSAAQAPGGGADQYSETFPGAGGNRPSNGGGSGGAGGSGGGQSDPSSGPLTPAQVEALEAQGADGAAAAAAAQSSGPEGAPGAGEDGKAVGGNQGSAAEGNSGSPAGEGDSEGSGVPELVGDVASGSDDGMGPVLPIVLAVALIGAVAFLIARRGGGQAGRA
jgi:hypothetical protein